MAIEQFFVGLLTIALTVFVLGAMADVVDVSERSMRKGATWYFKMGLALWILVLTCFSCAIAWGFGVLCVDVGKLVLHAFHITH